MAYDVSLSKEDVVFMRDLFDDIANSLCGCKSCDIDECSIFERLFIANKIVYNKITHSTTEANYTLIDEDGCVDWENISKKINTNYQTRNKYLNPSRRKILSWIYSKTYEKFKDDELMFDESATSSKPLYSLVFGEDDHIQFIIDNCIDECCNG